MKIIRVSKCGEEGAECPHFQHIQGYEHGEYYCAQQEPWQRIDNPDTIPDWCPLEEEKSEQDIIRAFVDGLNGRPWDAGEHAKAEAIIKEMEGRSEKESIGE